MSETKPPKPASKSERHGNEVTMPASKSERHGNEVTVPAKAPKKAEQHAGEQERAARERSDRVERKTDAQPAAKATAGAVIIKGKAVSTRGRTFTGTVISNRMTKTVTVEWERRKYVPKYQRYEKRRTRVKAHDEANAAEVGDIVEIVETRPISKTKNFMVTRIVKSAENS